MDLKGLESVFKKSGRPYWWLYKGNSKSTLLASYNGEDDIRPDIETSWQQLQEIVEEFGDGTYSVELKNNITQSRGTSFITFTIGEEKSVASKSDNFIQPGRFMAGLDMRYFL